MKVEVINNQVDLPLSVTHIVTFVKEALLFLEIDTDSIIIHFLNDEEMQHLHAELFDDPSSTDCITQPMDPPGVREANEDHFIGEAFICPKVAIDFSKEHNSDPYDEVALYIVHTLLHLKGHEDATKEGQDKMRLSEKATLDYLQEKKIFIR